MSELSDLPINEILGNIKSVLQRETRLVVQAPPGAGKTTGIPPALLDEPWLRGRKILLLEPRRLAARAAARRMAALLPGKVGGLVGYRTRLDSRAGPATRIEVVTEGVLTRMLQDDPELSAAGLVVFDEFHERSLQADLGLALTLDVQSALREDLRVVVMSATLAAQDLTGVLGAPLVAAHGKAYPVDTKYRRRPLQRRIEPEAVDEIAGVLEREAGSVLVFLPGAGEIRRTAALLAEHTLPGDVTLVPLYGNLSRAEQDRAILPAAPGTRKVVLATSIAETSLTIEGVRVVIDSGLMRVPRYDVRADMTRLETLPVSRAAAEQRRGRAGRSAPGVCYRLWTEAQDRGLRPHYEPEIGNADLASLALELALWGVDDPQQLTWVTSPPAGALQRARGLLRALGALDDSGRITSHGRRMAGAGLHPRLAHMVLQGSDAGLGGLACDLAALLSERDVLRFERSRHDADIRLRLDALHAVAASGPYDDRAGCSADAVACGLAAAASAQLQKRLGCVRGDAGSDQAGALIALAYPDRIAQKRAGTDYLLSGGRGAFLYEADPLVVHDYLAVAQLDGGRRAARIFLAAPLVLETVRQYFAADIDFEEQVFWDPKRQTVQAERKACFGKLVLQLERVPKPDAERVRAALLEGIASAGIELLPWTAGLRAWQARVMLLRDTFSAGEWPDVTDGYLARNLAAWLAPFVGGVRSASRLQSIDLKSALGSLLGWEQRRRLEEQAPTHLTVPSGSRVRLQYRAGGQPVLAVRLQELFGLRESPRIAGGRVTVLLHLLSPSMRPVQITADLQSFWECGYHEVKKDLKGRYPRHFWPDDPQQAAPTRRVKRR